MVDTGCLRMQRVLGLGLADGVAENLVDVKQWTTAREASNRAVAYCSQ